MKKIDLFVVFLSKPDVFSFLKNTVTVKVSQGVGLTFENVFGLKEGAIIRRNSIF